MVRADPLERSADRRRFQKIAFVFGVGLNMVVTSIAVVAWVPPEDQLHSRSAPVVGIRTGVALMGAALLDFAKRSGSVPAKPGKRSRF